MPQRSSACPDARGRVVYAVEDLEAWAAAHVRNSTSDPGSQPSSGGAALPRSELPRPR
jgi:hypothetical protein